MHKYSFNTHHQILLQFTRNITKQLHKAKMMQRPFCYTVSPSLSVIVISVVDESDKMLTKESSSKLVLYKIAEKSWFPSNKLSSSVSIFTHSSAGSVSPDANVTVAVSRIHIVRR